MSFRLMKAEVLYLNTKEEVLALVGKLFAYGRSESERNLKPSRLEHIKNKILSNEMRPFSWVVAYIEALGLYVNVDGQHSKDVFRNHMSDEDWEQVTYPVVIQYQEWACDTRLDIAALFEQFDTSWSARSRVDMIGAHLAAHPELMEVISKEAADKAVQGLQWYLENVEDYPRVSVHGQFELLHRNGEFATFYRFLGREGLRLDNKTRELAHKAVIAAMYHTTRRGNDSDVRFWRVVSARPEAILDEASHEYKLAVFLQKAVTQRCDWTPRQLNQFYTNKNPNPVEIYATCLRVFASWKKQLPITEAFAPVRDQSAKEVTRKLYPLKDVQQGTP